MIHAFLVFVHSLLKMPKLHGKDLSSYEDLDLDKLLSELNEEQLEELNLELIDPDVSDKCSPFSHHDKQCVFCHVPDPCVIQCQS